MKKNKNLKIIMIIGLLCFVIGVVWTGKSMNNIKDKEVEKVEGMESTHKEIEKEKIVVEKYKMLDMISEPSSKYVQATLVMDENNKVPYQNGIVYPNFTSQERERISLNGEWKKKRFDSDYNVSLKPRTIEWVKEIEVELGQMHVEDFNDSEWENKLLPSPENTLKNIESTEGVEPYESGVYYRRTFEVDKEFKDKKIYLKSLGVNYICDIWINGEWIGWHEGGFTPFAFDVSPYIRRGQINTIFIRVDNPPWGKRLDIIPAVVGTDFFNYTGVIQDLYLEVVDEVIVARNDLVTSVAQEDMAVLNNKLVITNHDKDIEKVNVTTRIYEADPKKYKESPSVKNIIDYNKMVFSEKVSLSFNEFGKENVGNKENRIYDDYVIEKEIKIEQAKLWDVYSPNLYVMEVEISGENNKVYDSHYIQFGVRKIETEDNKLILNGSNIFLRGIAKHEEWPGFGRTSSWERVKKDFDQMYEMGVNFIRTGHYPNHINTYAYLDRIGIPSMSEIPLWQLESGHFKAIDEKGIDLQMFREMVFSQYNSPSVILWSTQNECKGIPQRTQYNEKVVDDLRNNYDDFRLVTQSAAADHGGFKDPSMEPLDVSGWTMYFGVFHGSTPYNGTKNFLDQASNYWNKPILNTEYGVWSGETDGDAIKQDINYKKVFDAFMEFSTIKPNGYFNETGGLAGVDYWIMYNWYVNHNDWIDTFGIYHMDRAKMKKVGETIRNDYTRLKELDSNRNHMLNIKEIQIGKGSEAEGETVVIEVDQEALRKIESIENYNFIKMNVELKNTLPMVHLILEDNSGGKYDYYTDRIVKNTPVDICIPLYRIQNLEVKNLSKISFKFSQSQEFKIGGVRVD